MPMGANLGLLYKFLYETLKEDKELEDKYLRNKRMIDVRKITSLLVFVILMKDSYTQNSISIGPQIAIASSFNRTSKVGFGGGIEYTSKFSESFTGRASVGYSYFKGRYFNDFVSFLPARVGLQAGFSPQILVYVDLGVVLYNDNNGNNQSGLSYAFGAGYKIPLNTKQFIQLSANYNSFRYSST